jgi:hypothetical protein
MSEQVSSSLADLKTMVAGTPAAAVFCPARVKLRASACTCSNSALAFQVVSSI